MGNNSVPKFIFRLSRFPVYRGSVLGRVYCIIIIIIIIIIITLEALSKLISCTFGRFLLVVQEFFMPFFTHK